MTTHNLYTISSSTPVNITEGRDRGFDITIQNVNDSGYIFVGGEGVSTSDYGYRIMPNHAWSVEVSEVDDLYLVSSTDGMSAAILRLELERY